jgi:hypothetical protein
VFVLRVLGAVDLPELGAVGGFRWRSKAAADGVGLCGERPRVVLDGGPSGLN